MKKLQYKLLATNGTWTKEFLFFVQVVHGDIYYGFLNDDDKGEKTSRHASGHSHSKHKEYTINLGKGNKLSDYKGLHQLFVLSVGKKVFASTAFGRAPSQKPVNGEVLIDVRGFEQRVGIMAFLLEPGKAGHLDTLGSKLKNVQLTIMTEVKPWFVIAVYDAGMGKLSIDQPQMLPWDRTLLKVELPSTEDGDRLILIDGPSEQ